MLAKLIGTVALCAAVSGCEIMQVYSTAKTVKKAGCYVTSEELRAAIRHKQPIKTNICGDEIE